MLHALERIPIEPAFSPTCYVYIAARTRINVAAKKFERSAADIFVSVQFDARRRVVGEIRTQVPVDNDWPGNVRELEQCIQRILLKRNYEIDKAATRPGDIEGRLITGLEEGSMDAQQLLSHYCALLYERHNSYEEVARKTALDRRTVKKYIDQWYQNSGSQADRWRGLKD